MPSPFSSFLSFRLFSVRFNLVAGIYFTAAPLFYFLPHWGVAVNRWGDRPDFGQVLGVRYWVEQSGVSRLARLDAKPLRRSPRKESMLAIWA